MDVPDPGAASVAGVNVAVSPVGNPETEKETAAEKPLLTVEVTVIAAVAPCCNEALAGAAIAKFGAAAPLTTYVAFVDAR